MVTYRIKEGFWFWDALYFIQDEKGNNIYSLHKKWFAMDQALEMRDEQQQQQQYEEEEAEEVNTKDDANDGNDNIDATRRKSNNAKKEAVLTIRKKMLSFGPVFQVVRSDHTVVAEIKEKRVWFQAKHVVELADVQYIVDESKWNKKSKSFSVQHKGSEFAHVYKKNRMLDITGSFWVDIIIDPTYYEGQALKDMCATVLAACMIIIQLLCDNDRQALKREQEKERKEKLEQMPLQVLHSSYTQS